MSIVDEAIDVVAGGICVWEGGTVFGDSAIDLVGEDYVEIMGATGQNVDVEVVLALWPSWKG